MGSTATESLHIEPLSDGRWIVRLQGESLSSLHDSVTEAESIARDRARALGIETIVVRDRYRRVRTVRTHATAV